MVLSDPEYCFGHNLNITYLWWFGHHLYRYSEGVSRCTYMGSPSLLIEECFLLPTQPPLFPLYVTRQHKEAHLSLRLTLQTRPNRTHRFFSLSHDSPARSIVNCRHTVFWPTLFIHQPAACGACMLPARQTI